MSDTTDRAVKQITWDLNDASDHLEDGPKPTETQLEEFGEVSEFLKSVIRGDGSPIIDGIFSTTYTVDEDLGFGTYQITTNRLIDITVVVRCETDLRVQED